MEIIKNLKTKKLDNKK